MTKFADLPFDFLLGNRNAATSERSTMILNLQNDRLLFDFDGAGGDKAVKAGKITADVTLSLLDYDVIAGGRNAITGDGPTIAVNLKNGSILADADGAGGVRAEKIGHFDLDF